MLTNCCTTTEKHASYRWATAFFHLLARSYWGRAEKTLPACCCHPQNGARPSVRDAEAHSRVPQLSPRLCFDGKSGESCHPRVTFAANLHTFHWAPATPFTHSRAATHNKLSPHRKKTERVVLLKLFDAALTAAFRRQTLTDSHMQFTYSAHGSCVVCFFFSGGVWTASVGRFSAKWQSVNPGSFNSAALPLPGSQTVPQQDTAGMNRAPCCVHDRRKCHHRDRRASERESFPFRFFWR